MKKSASSFLALQGNSSHLRSDAEKLATVVPTDLEALSSQQIARILHELQVHQIELEMQNDELIKTQMLLDQQRERYFDLYDLAPVGYCTLTQEGMIIEANLTAATLLGVPRSELINQPFAHFVFSDDQDNYYLYRKKFYKENHKHSCDMRLVAKNKKPFWAHVVISEMENSNGSSVIRLVMSDISEKKSYEDQLHHIAQYDSLTNLPNRLLLSDRLRQGMTQSDRSELHLAVAYLDLDGFKEINDTYGHDVGDKVLIALSQRMKKVLRDGDTIARLGGDEFVILLIDLSKIEDAVPLIMRLLEASSTQLQIENLTLKITASIGVTFYPQNEDIEPDLLLRQADQAMYQAKLAGRNRYHVFNTQQDTILREKYEFIETISTALKLSQFVLHYQPKVNMKTSEIIGLEALIRWVHPQKGVLLPAFFLPMIEDTSLSIDIGEWVIDTVLSQIGYWNNQGRDIQVSINVSPRQLQEESFVTRLKAMLEKHHNVNPENLKIEILETTKIENISKTVGIINECRKLGVLFSLDDFGTGYSSLTYLQRLPISEIKIDQSFIHDMLENNDDRAILSGMIALAKAFGDDIIAEGVETVEQGGLLLKMGCYLAQGFAISRPLPASEVFEWIDSWESCPEWVSCDEVKA
jgi:diguanylate cyclase (GGDEF)-like protein/PAS domain S-box-containing protein